MKLRQDDNTVISNTNNEKAFTISASVKAFKILSDGLYSRKIEAIVRELSCNAWDSHVQAGCVERPFIVTLPTMWKPEFAVEDFGVGLSGDDIENIYTSFFTSTKTESNEVIGALGLGSKTPFSYTDAFNIRARKDGMERVYNAFIASNGMPAVSMLCENETTEPNGVKISVPVREADFAQFNSDAVKIFSWFSTLPIINNYASEDEDEFGETTNTTNNLNIDNSKAVRLAEEGYFWTEYGKHGNWARDRVVAVMGNVAYQIDSVTNMFKNELNESHAAFFKMNTIYIKFNIGDLDVAASRETISFDEDTREIFLARMLEIIEGYKAGTQKIIDQADGYCDAIETVDKLVGSWARALFTFQGVTLDVLGDHHAFKEIKAILMHKEERKRKEIYDHIYYYSSNSYSGNVRKQDMDYTYRTFIESLGMKFIFIQNCAHNVSTQIMRRYADQARVNVIAIHETLSENKLRALYDIFGKKNIIIEDMPTIKANDSLLRAEQRAEAKRLREEEIALNGGIDMSPPKAPRIQRQRMRGVLLKLDDVKCPGYVCYTHLEDNDDTFDSSLLEGIQSKDIMHLTVLRNRIDVMSIGEIWFDHYQKIADLARLLKVQYVLVTKQVDALRNDKILANALPYKVEDANAKIYRKECDVSYTTDMIIADYVLKNFSKWFNDTPISLKVQEYLTPTQNRILARYKEIASNGINKYAYDYVFKRHCETYAAQCSLLINSFVDTARESMTTDLPLALTIYGSGHFCSSQTQYYLDLEAKVKELTCMLAEAGVQFQDVA